METERIFPDNWKEAVRGKKVILYNTSVGSMLSGKEKHIKKMEWVFDVFREHPEAVLWWRPHPLELATMESMVPELAQRYRELRRQYKEAQIGILDESTDLHRAIAISDAYYGDWSSVTHLYRAIGKPVLYEFDTITRVTDTLFFPVALCVKDNAIWFIQLNSNKLIMMDQITYEVMKIIDIPLEPSFFSRDYNYHIIDFQNRLFLLLEGSRRIYEYDIDSDVMKVHKPRIDNFVFRSEAVLKRDNKLFMFPGGNHDIWEYEQCTDTMIKREFGQKNRKLSKCYEVIGTKVYLTDQESNALYQYDLIEQQYNTIHIGGEDSRYWGVKKVGRYFVLPHTDKKAITIWNEENEELTEMIQFPGQYACEDKYAYLDMFEKDGYVYIFPFYANMILKIDMEKKVLTQAFTDLFFDARHDSNSEQIDCGMYLCARRYGDYVFAYATYRECWQIFDLAAMNVQESPAFKIKNMEHKKLLECLWDGREHDVSFCEGERPAICNLENYISNIVNNDVGNKRRDIGRDDAGRKIYQYIKACE